MQKVSQKQKSYIKARQKAPKASVKGIKQIGKEYVVCGFIHKIRDHGKIVFLELRDSAGIIQVVAEKAKLPTQVWQSVKKLTRESVICARGIAQKPAAKLAPHLHELELHLTDITVHSIAKTPLPFDPFDAEKVRPKIRFDFRWLDLRDPKKQLIFKIWTVLEEAFTGFVRSRGFTQIHTPKIMPVASEGQDELFYLDYFGKPAYLAQSAQFYKQMAIAAGFEKVFQIGPVFRATRSFTTRHDTEFTQYDIEIAWADYHDLMDLEEEMLVHMMQALKDKLGEQIKQAYGVQVEVPTRPFPRLKLSEAKELLQKVPVKVRKPGDLSPEEERKLGKLIKQKYGHDFVFVTHYPKEKRAFYHMAEPDAPEYAAGYDLLYKGLEITTGSTREHRIEYLKKYAKERGEDLGALEYYFKFFEYGVPPHAGFGFGPSRYIKQLLGLPHVREATFLPRMVNRLVP